MENLPLGILGNILHGLPIETALQAKRVCKTWKTILRCKTDKIGLLFALSYLSDGEKKNELFYGDYNRGKLNYRHRYHAVDGMEDEKSVMGNNYVDDMLGSCNGLVCFQRRHEHCFRQPFLICNPLIGEVVYVRPYTDLTGKSLISGFGYCHTTNEYKIVRMHLDCIDTKKYYLGYKEPKNYNFQVYTVGGGHLRNKESINFEKIAKKESIHISPEYSGGIYADGAIHWLHRRISYLEYEDFTTAADYKISAFDLADENFRFIPLPTFKDVKYKHPVDLLGGSNLYLVYTIHDNKPYCTDIWAYKITNTNNININGSCDIKKDKEKRSCNWIKEFRIEWEEPYWKHLEFVKPLAITRNDEFLFRCYTTLYSYDLKTSILYTLFDGRDMDCCMINVILHANNLVSMRKRVQARQ